MAKPSQTYAYALPLVKLGKTIRQLRGLKGLSQEQLAYHAGLDRSYLGGIERGEHNLALINLLKIAGALGISLERLFATAKL